MGVMRLVGRISGRMGITNVDLVSVLEPMDISDR